MLRRLLSWDVVSNLAYAVAGITAARGPDPLDWLFLGTMVALGLGSGVYHAGVKHGNHLDVGLMFVLGGIFIATAAHVHGLLGAVLTLAASLLLAYVLRFRLNHIKMEYKIPVLYAVALGVAAFMGVNWVYMGAALGLLAVAGVFRFLVHRPWAHGVWHIVTAPALSLWYLSVAR